MGYLLDKAEKEGNFNKYKKYLFIRIFFDVLLFVTVLWSFYYTGSYYAGTVNECYRICPCLNKSASKIPALGAWTNESTNFSFNIDNITGNIVPVTGIIGGLYSPVDNSSCGIEGCKI